MSKTYAIADLQDRFDLLEMALACLAKRAEHPGALVTLGEAALLGVGKRRQGVERRTFAQYRSWGHLNGSATRREVPGRLK